MGGRYHSSTREIHGTSNQLESAVARQSGEESLASSSSRKTAVCSHALPIHAPHLLHALRRLTHVKVQVVELDAVRVLAGDVHRDLDHALSVLIGRDLDRVFLDNAIDDLGVFPIDASVRGNDEHV
jgi:hypothetical protein